LARTLDDQIRRRGVTRSEAVEQAFSEWVRRQVEERGLVDGLGAKVEVQDERAARGAHEARIAAQMVLEALRYQFPSLSDVGDAEHRRLAVATLSRTRNGSSLMRLPWRVRRSCGLKQLFAGRPRAPRR
jgi:hypothetical protein